MVRAQRAQVAVQEVTWTVLGANFLPVPGIELFLEHVRETPLAERGQGLSSGASV